MTPRDFANVLLAKASQDLYAMRVLAADARIADAAVGFHAQQAIEKALKAVLTAAGVRAGRTHALGYLIELLADAGIARPAWADQALAFDPYAVTWRYAEVDPDEVLDRGTAVTLVEQVLAWATTRCDELA